MPIEIDGTIIQDQADSTLTGSTTTPAGTDALTITSIGSYATGLGEETAEIAAYDKGTKQLFVMKNFEDAITEAPLGSLDIVDMSDPTNLTKVGEIDVAADINAFSSFGGINSVAVSNGLVAVAVENAVKSDPGFVAFYSASTGDLLKIVEVGALPDMLVFTADGKKLLVANEGERALDDDDNEIGDAPGSISLVDLSAGVANASVQSAGFGAFDGFEDALRAQGVRITPGRSASADIEPEYITITQDGKTAFVTLQEANSVAEFDISGTTPVLERIVPLGFVDHSLEGNESDYSDRDGAGSSGAIFLHTAPIKGLLMPDAVASWTFGGVTYFATANEGDARSDDSDVQRLKDFDGLDPSIPAPPAGEADYDNDDNAGRLNVSTYDSDPDNDGIVEEIVTFGGRGFTIFQQGADGTVTKVFESGGEFEAIIAEQFPDLFNNNQTGDASTFDARSDDKGPEPESIAVHNVGGRFYAFVALEREGGVMVYDVTDPANATFTTYVPSSTTHLGPETVQYIEAVDSPTGEALMVTTNEISGTIEVYTVEPKTFTLQLLHLSDGEAGLLAAETAPNLAALIDAFDDDFANTLILSGGDNFLPGPFLAAGTDASVIPVLNEVSGSNIPLNSVVPIGAVDTAIHNVLGVEASTIGNHEFDLGSNAFAASFTPSGGWVGATFPYMSANLDFSGDTALNPRFTNTLDGSDATLVPDASTLKGRIAPATVVEKGGEKIGLVAVTTQMLESISSPSGTEVKGFPTGLGPNGESDDMDLLAAQIQPIVDELIAEGINKIILMAHLQVIANEQLLATKLKGVDIILSAGSNTRLGDADDEAVDFPGHAANFAGDYPLQVTDADGKTTLIVNTDNEYTYLGRLVVDFDADGNIILDSVSENQAINGAYASTEENVAEAWGVDEADLDDTAFAEGTKGDKVRDLVDAVQDVIEVKDGNVLGYTNVYLEGERLFVRNQETNLGNLSADSYAYAARDALGDDAFIVSLKNGGGIRAQIGTISPPDPVDGTVDKLPPPANPAVGKSEGGVSQLDIENSMRFNNRLMVFDTDAQGLLNILNHGVAALPNNGRFPQIGGVKFSYDPDRPAGTRVVNVALIDEQGNVIARVVENGVVVAGAPNLISVVTADFTADGGDSYPMRANGSNFRYIFDDGTLSDPIDESLDFNDDPNIPSNVVREQAALGDYMQAFHGTPDTAFDQADTGMELDERIENLNFRDDVVFESPAIVGSAAGEAIDGTVGDDDIDGRKGSDRLFGLVGDDTLKGGNDNDQLFGDQGSDLLLGQQGDDQLFGGEGNDTLRGVDGNDTLLGEDGNDLLDGKIGNDQLLGGDGNDTLDGGAGIDVMIGGDGDDVYLVDALADLVVEQAAEGADTVRSTIDYALGANLENLQLVGAAVEGVGNDLANKLTGTDGDNILSGEGGNDTVTGGKGADDLFGGAGQDLLNGGLGDDTMTGGADADLFVFATGADTIADFSGVAGGELDRIDLRPVAGLSDFADVLARMSDVNGNVEIDFTDLLGVGHKLVIENVTVAQLNANDFLV